MVVGMKAVTVALLGIGAAWAVAMPATATARPAVGVSVSPSRSLVDHQTVTVKVTGFTACCVHGARSREKAYLSKCATLRGAGPMGAPHQVRPTIRTVPDTAHRGRHRESRGQKLAIQQNTKAKSVDRFWSPLRQK
jgi:hypothetical protein